FAAKQETPCLQRGDHLGGKRVSARGDSGDGCFRVGIAVGGKARQPRFVCLGMSRSGDEADEYRDGERDQAIVRGTHQMGPGIRRGEAARPPPPFVSVKRHWVVLPPHLLVTLL